MLKIRNVLVNYLKKSVFYWKYRNFFQRKVWDNYLNDSNSPRRLIYKKFVKKYKLKSVFDFGCASGPNYFTLLSEIDFYFGFDISQSAINTIKRKIKYSSSNYFFTTNIQLFKEFLTINKLNKVDLAIYDRVLYLLSYKEVENHFNCYGSFFKYVIIDDFYSENIVADNDNYLKTKNFIFLLKNFNLIEVKDSKFKPWNDFTKNYSKILIFKNKNK